MSWNRRKIKMVVNILAATLVMGLIGHGCGNIGEVAKSSSSSAGGASGTDDFTPIEGARTASTVYAKQVLDNMVSCTGIGAESATTKGVWDSRKGSLSDFGYAIHITAPMLMAIASVAGEVCNDLITVERALPANQRNIFGSFDFSATPSRLPAKADVSDAVSRLALSCWQRNSDTEELSMIETDVVDSIGGSSDQQRVYNAALMVCTSMLSSLSAIEM